MMIMEKVKVGIVDIHTSHPDSFASYLHKGNRARDEVGEILSVFTNIGVDEFNYGVHAMEMVQGLLGPGAEAVSSIASSKEIAQYLVEYEER